MFFIERAVLYPVSAFIFFGGLVYSILPAIIIVMGIKRSDIRINHQNMHTLPIKFANPDGDAFIRAVPMADRQGL